MKKVAIYIRVSTREQEVKGYSIEGQKDRLINYCKAKEWAIYDIYIDGGYTGANTDRPALQKMLKELDSIDSVLVYKLDRLSRSQKDVLDLVEDRFIPNNVDFVSMSENFDTSTPFGRAMLGILSVFAQLERETIKERATMGKEKRAEKGLYRGGGNTPHGYEYIEESQELIVDKYEAIHVKEIFRLYNEGKGYMKICKIMNKKGYKKRNGVDWRTNAVKRILTNPIYCGFIKYKGKQFEGMHESIISRETWEETQTLMKSRSNNNYKSKNNYLLSGITYCGYCNARVRGTWISRYKGGPRHHYYRCYSSSGTPLSMVKDPNCPAKHRKMKEVDKYIVAKIKEKATVDKEEIRQRYLKEQGQTSLFDISTLEERIKDIDKQIDRVMDLYQFGNIPASEISRRIDKMHKEKKSLEREIEDNRNKIDEESADIEGILEILDNFDYVWEKATDEEKVEIVRLLINRIIITNEDIKVEFAF